jgi:hypothetical protein
MFPSDEAKAFVAGFLEGEEHAGTCISKIDLNPKLDSGWLARCYDSGLEKAYDSRYEGGLPASMFVSGGTP